MEGGRFLRRRGWLTRGRARAAEVFWYGPTPPRALAFAGRGRFYCWPGRGLGHARARFWPNIRTYETSAFPAGIVGNDPPPTGRGFAPRPKSPIPPPAKVGAVGRIRETCCRAGESSAQRRRNVRHLVTFRCALSPRPPAPPRHVDGAVGGSAGGSAGGGATLSFVSDDRSKPFHIPGSAGAWRACHTRTWGISPADRAGHKSSRCCG